MGELFFGAGIKNIIFLNVFVMNMIIMITNMETMKDMHANQEKVEKLSSKLDVQMVNLQHLG